MKSQSLLPGIAIALVLFATLFVLIRTAHAFITVDTPAQENRLVNYTLFATSTTDTFLATTTTATSSNMTAYTDSNGVLDTGKINITGAKKVTFYFSREGWAGNAGLSKFFVEVSPDCSTWYAYNKLVGNDISATATSTVTISAATSTTIVSMNLANEAYMCARVAVQEITDGKHAAKATVQF